MSAKPLTYVAALVLCISLAGAAWPGPSTNPAPPRPAAPVPAPSRPQPSSPPPGVTFGPLPPNAPSPPGHVVEGPRWLELPSEDVLTTHYPERARSEHRGARVNMMCTAQADGRLVGCLVLWDDPTGYGFGDAALRLSRFYKMAPEDSLGRPVGGGKVNVLLVFSVSNDGVVALSTPPVPAPRETVYPAQSMPPATPPTARPASVTTPVWTKKPTYAELARYYPRLARQEGLSGRATIRCLVNASGGLGNCQVILEDPPGYGFGEAALQLARFFELAPAMPDGSSVEGAVVSFPIVFHLSS